MKKPARIFKLARQNNNKLYLYSPSKNDKSPSRYFVMITPDKQVVINRIDC